MQKTILFLFLMLMAVANFAHSQEDSVVRSRRSILVVPSLTHQPETSWAAGVGYGVYLKSSDLSRISSITGGANYSLLNQFTFSITPRIFFKQSRWYLYANASVKNYPDFYYGISSQPTTVRVAFRSQNLSVLLQPQIRIAPHLLLGLSVSGRYEKIYPLDTPELTLSLLQAKYGAAGWDPYGQLNLGGLLSYDSRDNQFYPTRGLFLKTVATVAGSGWGSSYSIADLSVDYRQFIQLYPGHIVAIQSWVNGVWGSRGVPFQLLPTLGGLDLMRGFTRGMYRGNLATVVQTEYRVSVFHKLKASVFGSAGDVWNNEQTPSKLKVAWGVGLRYQLNDARVHLRVDVAQNNYDHKWQYYLTASEAF